MNKPKYQMTSRAKKKMNKEVRNAPIQSDVELKSDQLKAKNLLSRLPKKVQKKEAASLKSLDKNIAVQRTKQHAKHSKRTTPGTVEGQPAAPRSVHIEGKRWSNVKETKIQAKKKGR